MSKKTQAITVDDPALVSRVDGIVANSTLSRDDVVRGALEEGRSLAWQERWVAGIREGLAEADRGEFASPEEIERVRSKYRRT